MRKTASKSISFLAVLEAVRCDNDLLQDRVDRLEAYLMRLQRETLSSREEGKCLYSKCTEMVHNKEELKNKVDVLFNSLFGKYAPIKYLCGFYRKILIFSSKFIDSSFLLL